MVNNFSSSYSESYLQHQLNCFCYILVSQFVQLMDINETHKLNSAGDGNKKRAHHPHGSNTAVQCTRHCPCCIDQYIYKVGSKKALLQLMDKDLEPEFLETLNQHKIEQTCTLLDSHLLTGCSFGLQPYPFEITPSNQDSPPFQLRGIVNY